MYNNKWKQRLKSAKGIMKMTADLKEKIMFFIFEQEKQCRLTDIVAKSKSHLYYQVFENTYNEDRIRFADALLSLSKLNDSIYDCLTSKINESRFFCYERIIVGVLRIRVCFDIETESIRTAARRILDISIDKIQSKDLGESWTGTHLYADISRFIFESIELSNNESPQHFLENKAKLKAIFTDFLSLEDVKNTQTASLYHDLYKHKMVSSCPLYIKQALRLSNIYENSFVSVSAWEEYFCKKSDDKIEKDISLFKQIGFVFIPDVMTKIKNAVENERERSTKTVELSNKQQRKRICGKIIKRYKAEIERAEAAEPFEKIVDYFLGSKLNNVI